MDAVCCEPLSVADFPFKRENNGNFADIGSLVASPALKTDGIAWVCQLNSRSAKAGILSGITGDVSNPEDINGNGSQITINRLAVSIARSDS